MKISQDTLNILKNFSTINKGIVIRKNKPLSTVSELENIYAITEIQESFPCDIGIYDLTEFLGTLGLFQSPVLNFGNDDKSNFVVIKEENGNSTVKYRFDDITLITSPTEQYEIPSNEIEFDLSQADIQKILKACGVMGLSNIVIASTEDGVSVIARDPTNKLSNFFELDVLADNGGHKFEFVINSDNLKLISGDYHVTASKEGSVLFQNTTKGSLSYLIALEETSTYS